MVASSTTMSWAVAMTQQSQAEAAVAAGRGGG
jgi:hypothetical protein